MVGFTLRRNAVDIRTARIRLRRICAATGVLAVAGIALSYLLLWPITLSLAMLVKNGSPGGDLRFHLYLLGFYFFRFSLPFMLLHLPALLLLWQPFLLSRNSRNRKRSHPVFVSALLAVLVSVVLRGLFQPEQETFDWRFWLCFLASVVTGAVVGLILVRSHPQQQHEQQQQPHTSEIHRRKRSAHAALITLAGLLLCGFLFYYLVSPGRYIYNDHMSYRRDWLIGDGKWEYMHEPG